MKNEQRAKLAKRAELPRVKLEYAPKCRAPIWHRVEVGRAQLDRVKLARVKKRTRQTGLESSVGLDWRPDGPGLVRNPLLQLRFGTLPNPFTPLCQCLSEETLKAVGPFYLVSMPGDVKYIPPVRTGMYNCHGLHHPL